MISQKIPFAQSINTFTERKIEDAIGNQGQEWPCRVVSVDGQMVTVEFLVNSSDPNNQFTIPQVTVPIFGSEYVRLPIQVGCLGVCFSASVSLRQVSGLGTGQADFSNAGNLTSLVFFPVGNKQWFSVNGNYLVMYGVDGVEITTPNQDCKLTLTSSGVTVDLNGGNLTINNGNNLMSGNLTIDANLLVKGSITGQDGINITGGSGSTMNITGNISQTGNFENSGSLTNNGKNVGSTHVHSGVQSGGSDTGAPV